MRSRGFSAVLRFCRPAAESGEAESQTSYSAEEAEMAAEDAAAYAAAEKAAADKEPFGVN